MIFPLITSEQTHPDFYAVDFVLNGFFGAGFFFLSISNSAEWAVLSNYAGWLAAIAKVTDALSLNHGSNKAK